MDVMEYSWREVEVEERWGEDQEVAMDIEFTEEDEQRLLSEISSTRGSEQLHPLSSSAFSSLPSISSHDMPSTATVCTVSSPYLSIYLFIYLYLTLHFL